MKEISAGIILYRKTREGLKFLLLYHGGGYWNFPKGKIEYANSASLSKDFGNAKAPIRIETSFQAALREIREETGLTRHDLKFNKYFKGHEQFAFWRGSGAKKIKIFKTVIFYLAETRNRYIRISKEHDGYAWFTFKEAMKILVKYKENQKILIRACGFLRPRTTRINYEARKNR